jgi:hypothetical protein
VDVRKGMPLGSTERRTARDKGGTDLDDTDGDGLPHVTHGKATQGWVGGESLHAHGFRWLHLDVGGVSILDELGGGLQLLSGTAIDLGGDLGELAGDVGCVAIQDRGVSVSDLARVVHDDDLHTSINYFNNQFD